MTATPFAADGAVAEAELPRVVAFGLENGCHGVSALGLGGEVDHLAPEERRRIAEVVVAAAAGAPVVIGCSSPETALSLELAVHAAEAGAAVVMLAAPRRLDWTRPQLHEHYAAVARAIAPLPLMVQDAPAFVGVALDADFVAALRADCANVTYAKPESVPAADRTAELVALGGIHVFAGHGALHYLDALEAGAHGIIPGCELPAAFVRIYEEHRAGRVDEARAVFARVLPLVVSQFQTLDLFIAASKTLLVELGVIERADTRSGARVSPLARRLLLEHARFAGAL
jgi:4-hydroxy-tetrahydrodipicolinate synthase